MKFYTLSAIPNAVGQYKKQNLYKKVPISYYKRIWEQRWKILNKVQTESWKFNDNDSICSRIEDVTKKQSIHYQMPQIMGEKAVCESSDPEWD